MKKMIALVLALVAGGYIVSLGKSADDSNNRVAVMQRGDVFKVIYDSPGLNKVDVKIYDESGKVVFSETLNSRSGFIRPYNFEKMPEGDYNISVVDESGEYTEKISSRAQKPNTLWAAHVDKLRGDDRRYLVAVPHQENSDIIVHIYNEQDELLHTEQESMEGGFARIYNLKEFDGPATFFIVNQTTGEEMQFKTDDD